jgi:3-oxoacyl-[acyl-carrier-protein] synthase III
LTENAASIVYPHGAGAIVLQGCSDKDGQLLASDLGVDGSLRGILYAELGGKL